MSEQHEHELTPLRLPVFRHLQDYNGYCGPACALMIAEAEGRATEPAHFAQNEIFRSIRDHARDQGDRRPVKSPAESLLALLNRAESAPRWAKHFDAEPLPVARRVLAAVEKLRKPCVLLVSKGMHWVVAFGRMRKDDGSPAGLLLRDPAWAGMPRFFGLSVFPDKPAMLHSRGDEHRACACLSQDPQPGTVHERYIAMDELLSERGLQGSPDWEGRGALALVPMADELEPSSSDV